MHSHRSYIQRLLILFALAQQAQATSLREQIDTQVKAFLTPKAVQTAQQLSADQFAITVHPPTRNNKLPACKTILKVETIKAAPYGEQMLQVNCPDHWKLIVKARIQIFMPIILSRHSIRKDKIIHEDDIQWRSQDISISGQNYLTRPEQVVGKRTHSAIKTDTAITPAHLREIRQQTPKQGLNQVFTQTAQ